ncbi:ribosome biogenesis protein SLX9-domain-containing protein [Xylariaceae sp. FL0804]|nr:ribosome biogenesis protein SLX9-domain-containing protein [Xylariaceae sp. FL0804]
MGLEISLTHQLPCTNSRLHLQLYAQPSCLPHLRKQKEYSQARSTDMAPVAPAAAKRRVSLRAKLAARSAAPHAPRRAPRPDAAAPSAVDDAFTESKRERRLVRHNALVSRIEKAHARPAAQRRRRPGKKLLAAEHLGELADALPELEEEKKDQQQHRQQQGRARHQSLRSKRGALARKEKVVRGEVRRFGDSLAKLNAVGAAAAGHQGSEEEAMQVVSPPPPLPVAGETGDEQQQQQQQQAQSQSQSQSGGTASRWAALRGFISATMDQNPAFAEKKDGGNA